MTRLVLRVSPIIFLIIFTPKLRNLVKMYLAMKKEFRKYVLYIVIKFCKIQFTINQMRQLPHLVLMLKAAL